MKPFDPKKVPGMANASARELELLGHFRADSQAAQDRPLSRVERRMLDLLIEADREIDVLSSSKCTIEPGLPNRFPDFGPGDPPAAPVKLRTRMTPRSKPWAVPGVICPVKLAAEFERAPRKFDELLLGLGSLLYNEEFSRPDRLSILLQHHNWEIDRDVQRLRVEACFGEQAANRIRARRAVRQILESPELNGTEDWNDAWMEHAHLFYCIQRDTRLAGYFHNFPDKLEIVRLKSKPNFDRTRFVGECFIDAILNGDHRLFRELAATVEEAARHGRRPRVEFDIAAGKVALPTQFDQTKTATTRRMRGVFNGMVDFLLEQRRFPSAQELRFAAERSIEEEDPGGTPIVFVAGQWPTLLRKLKLGWLLEMDPGVKCKPGRKSNKSGSKRRPK